MAGDSLKKGGSETSRSVAENREPLVRIRVFPKPQSIFFLFGTGRAQEILWRLWRVRQRDGPKGRSVSCPGGPLRGFLRNNSKNREKSRV